MRQPARVRFEPTSRRRQEKFFDPNGLRRDVTVRTEPPGFGETQKAQSRQALRDWQAFKAKRKLALA